MMFQDLYSFPQECKSLLQGHHQGEIIAGVNFNSNENGSEMSRHRILTYYLYPTISTRLDNQAPKDIIILYKKKDPLAHIPEGYKMLLKHSNNNYILLQKKGKNAF
ncbi:MAG: hypothetical protein K8S27_07170 [Candidatus Omnitrophica bacterium]|nr:hypothetical protein [Candidatus Omnitrophota bacterium]